MIVGAVLGARFTASSFDVSFGLLAGAALGWVVAEIFALRRRIALLEERARDESARYAQGQPLEPVAAERAAREIDEFNRKRHASEAASADPASPRETPAAQAAAPPDYTRPAGLPAADELSQPSGSLTRETATPRDSARTREPMPSGERAKSGEFTSASRSSAPPSEPAPPRENEVIRLIREYFTGGNTLVRVGIIILFIGVAFLLRYVAERTQVPIELRLAGVALGAIVLLVLGWRLRTKRQGYALALQGGATAILYLIVFASMRLYSVLPPTAAFALMVLIVVFSGMLAVLQSSIELAVIGIVGGFLAPVLASTGQGSHVVLFSYYAVLNTGILGIAWFKAWRPLNVLGFLFTFVIGIAWGVLRYRGELFATTEPFLIYFFLLYVAVAVLFASRQPPRLKGYVDGSIVFGTPIAAFSLQSALLHDRSFALAFSALAVSALYLVLAWILFRRRRDTYRLLVEAFMALGVLFLTLAIPLALDGKWSAATWALEGASLVWIGCRQNRRLPRVSGAVLQIAAGVIFWRDSHHAAKLLPILNSAFLGGVMIAAGAIFSSHVLNRHRPQLARYEGASSIILFFYGLLWWLIAGFTEIARLSSTYDLAIGLVFVTVTAFLCSELHRRLSLAIARVPVLALLPAMVLFTIFYLAAEKHAFAFGGWLAWPLSFAGFYFLLHRYDPEPNTPPAGLLHTPSAWLLVGLLGWESAWAIDNAVQGGGSWPAIGWVLLPAVALLSLLKWGGRIAWPLGRHRETYIAAVGGGIALYLSAWVIYTNFAMPGDPYPLPYIPFLNPLDLAEVAALLVLARFALQVRRERFELLQGVAHRAIATALALLAFLWLNGVLVRTLHHWANIPFDSGAMMASTLAQTAVSIFWTVIALTTMLIATRRSSRIVWLGGAVLLAIVVGKLFLVDLSRVGSVERIISFVGVGVLMLVIGYFSPLPPAAKSEAK